MHIIIKKYNYLIIGFGLYGANFAQQAHAAGKSVLGIDTRLHIGGNVYTGRVEGISIHKYGAHIFHANDEAVAKIDEQRKAAGITNPQNAN